MGVRERGGGVEGGLAGFDRFTFLVPALHTIEVAVPVLHVRLDLQLRALLHVHPCLVSCQIMTGKNAFGGVLGVLKKSKKNWK